ncbi:MAG TPA: MtrB/PioB family outer membrane beta-barrel protein [Vicinamibacteria bacterium]|nr:MtrB/PioB family outer membrane beta-barrel protein [Vicinamibacteria bacterium]
MTMKNNARRLSVGLALSLLAWPALGQDSKTSGAVSVGAQGGSGINDSSKLQQYEVVPEGVFLAGAKLSWKGGSDYFLDLKGTNLGLDDQAASLLFGKKGSFKLKVSWDQNPNWMSNTARTPFTETSPGVLQLPDGMQQALQNVYVPWIPGTASNPVGTGSAPANPTAAGFFAVDPWVSNSQPIDLRYVRKTGKAGLSFPIGNDLNVNVTYSRETRQGNKNTTFYGGPDYEVATPIDFKTHDFRAEADYAKGRFFASASANFSKFVNDVPYAVIDNPQRLELVSPLTGRNVINDVATFRLWLPPDNKAYTVDFAGGVTLPKKHKVTATVSTGSMSMETDLLPLSTNANLATSATAPNSAFSIIPPYDSVSIDYRTFLGALKLTGDPIGKFGYSLTFRRFQLKDENDDYAFPNTVRGDVGASRPSTPYVREHHGYQRQSLRAEVHALPASGLRLGLSYGQDTSDYDVREFSDVADKVLTASVDYNRSKLSFHGAFTNLKREPGSENEHAIQPTWQGATQTDITERHRNLLSVLLTVMPKDTLSITFSGMRQTNEFAESVTGLLDQSFDQFGVDLSYVPSDKLSLTAGYVYEKYFFDMAAAYFPRVGSCPTCGPVPPNFDPKADPNYWSNATTDKIDTFRAGLAVTLKPEKIHANLDLDYAKPRSNSAYTFVAGGAGEANGVWPATPVVGFPTSAVAVPTTFTGFPQVSKNFLIAKVRLSYRLEKNLTVSAMYWKQKFDNVDWQTQNTLAYMGRTDPGSNRWFFLGAQVPSYDANIFSAALTYKF